MVARSSPACASCSASARVASAWRTSATSVSLSPVRTMTVGGVSPTTAMSTVPSSTSARARAASATVRNRTSASRCVGGGAQVAGRTRPTPVASARRGDRDVVARGALVEDVGQDHRDARADEEHREHDPQRLAPERLAQLASGDESRGAAARSRGLRRRPPRGTARTGSAPRPRSRRPARGGGCRRGPRRDRRAVRGAAGCRGRRPIAISRGHAVDPRRVDGDVDAQPAVRALGLQRAEVAVQHDPAVVQQGDRLAEVLDQVELVAREQQVAAGARVLGDDVGEEAHRDAGRARRTARRAPGARARAPSPPRAARVAPCRPTASRSCRARARRGRAARAAQRAPTARRRGRDRGGARSTPGGRARACRGRGRAPAACSPSRGGRRRSPARSCHDSVPASGARTPKRIRISVVLPAPLGPRRPTTRPRGHVEVDGVEHDAVTEALADATRREPWVHG